MNIQEAFDLALNGIIGQVRPSWGATGGKDSGCLYRGPNGCKCAIGWVIPDAEYQPRFDQGCLLEEVVIACPTLRRLDLDFLIDLQKAHDVPALVNGEAGLKSEVDMLRFVLNFLTGMEKLAKKYGLVFALYANTPENPDA